MLSYRGYGLSSGQPSERGIRIDAQTALDWIRNHPVLKETLLVTYGQSIGGAVAIDLAARNPKRVSSLSRRAKAASRYARVSWRAPITEGRLTVISLPAPDTCAHSGEHVSVETLGTQFTLSGSHVLTQPRFAFSRIVSGYAVS